MNILLTGANGFIGQHLAGKLQREGHHVIACVRDPVRWQLGHPDMDAITCDFTDDTDERIWVPRLANIDAIINAVGIIRETGKQTFNALHRDTPIALFRAAEKAGVRKIIQISALGADDTAESEYHLTKKAADDVLSSLDLPWTILRPSIVYGPGAKSTALFRALAALPITPIIGDGEQPVQPIHIDDVVEVIVQSLEPSRHNHCRLNLVGPVPIIMRDLLAKQRTWLGEGALRELTMPYGLALPLAHVGGFLGSAPITPQTIAMLQRGNTADVEPFIKACGFRPRSLNDALSRCPATKADMWHARLYFLAPLLRFSLALLWIFTAIVSAFVFPIDESYALLAQVGIEGALAPIFLYGAAGLDFILGVALLNRKYVEAAALAQISVMLGYSVIISIALPEYWIHPYGPIIKNIPLMAATWVMMELEKR